MKRFSILTALLFACLSINAQMVFDGVSQFGNEWVNHERPYAKVSIDQDGVYRITYAELISNGFPNNIKGSEIQVYSFGQEVAIHVSSNDTFGNGDFVEFYGFKNKGELDNPLYEDWNTQQLNPKHSMFSDERAYFFTWTPGSNNNLRYDQVSNGLSGNLPQVESFYIHKEELVFSSDHVRPVINESLVRYSSFFTTEGFGSTMKKINTISLPASNINNSIAQSKVNLRFGTNAGNHIIRSSFNGDFLDSKTYNSYNVVVREFEIPTSDIKNNNEFILAGTSGEYDRNSIASISLEYPRSFNALNQDVFRFSIAPHSFKKYFEISDFNTSGGDPVVMDISNNVRLQSVVENGVVKFALESASSIRDIVVFNSRNDFVSITETTLVNYDNENPSYVILTSKKLDVADGSGTNWIEQYADFRRSDLGDSYDVLIVHIEDVIDQFGFGIQDHSIAVRNWSNYLFTNWSKWEHCFIVGKTYEYGILKEDESLEGLVPTHGEPGADNIMFSTGINTYPEIGVGRLAANSTDQIKLYFEKMNTYVNTGVYQQSIEDKLWMKKVIHLSGGDALIQETLRSNLASMAKILENSSFGANVITFQKTTSDPIQTSLSQSIIDEVNEGCSIITFFGHSAVGTFDFSIENPSQFDNHGKTPLIISLGCHSGNIHTRTPGMSEDFVLVPEKGAIAFLASSGTAYVNPQYIHGLDLYTKKGNSFYGKPLGTIMADVLKAKTNNADFQVFTLQQQLTLHGDPALVINSHEGPDYTPDLASFRTSPEVVSGRLDSIDICFDIVNLGKHQFDTINYYMVHKYANEKDTFYFESTAPFNRINNCQTIPIDVVKASGENNIEIYLDHVFEIEEVPGPSAEMNNSLRESYGVDSYTFFVLNDNPIPFFPEEFAITNKEQLVLMASTGNAFVGSTTYDIEIDTTELFDSPFKKSAVIEAHGGLVKWQPDIQYEEYQVYYWRVRAAEPEFGLSYWNNSSFMHVDEYSSGWNQSDLYQYLKDDINNIEIDSTTRDFDYVLANYEFSVTNVKNDGNDFAQVTRNSVFLGGHYSSIIQAGVYFLIADPQTLQPQLCPSGGALGADNPVDNEATALWPFRTTDATQRAEIVDFLNQIPDNYYVFMFTAQTNFFNYKPQEWEEELFDLFENEGAVQIRDLTSGARPYIFAYQKGVKPLNEQVAVTEENEINSIISIEAKWYEGNISSTTIGPAKTWNKLLWDISDYNQAEDLLDIRILGIDNDGNEEALATNIVNKEYDLSTINAAEYPYLRLELFTRDTISHTSLDLDYWRVVYSPLPEAVINTVDNFVFHADTLERGEIMNIEYQIENISMSNMDSMLVRYSIFDSKNAEISSELRKSPIQMASSIPDKFEYDTDDLDGPYQLRVEINPEFDQPEQFSFNNRGLINFFVRSDDINPLLDVTFDGVRILEGDIISPVPMIKIALSDENRNQLIDSPESFELTILYPGESAVQEIDLNDPNVNFIPASEENGYTACIEYTPTFGAGEYTLNVQGWDATGNISGDHEYSITFNVYEDNLISNVLNYPNPFSTSTEFIFTLTGDKLPQDYHIKIMTLSGKVVREITAAELGPIRVGVNRSEYKWNGTDEYGSKLANGVYLYRFYSDIEEDLDEFKLDDVDQYFKEGFGKLVIMR